MAEPDLAELRELRGALLRARASGLREVSYSWQGGERRLSYQTDDALAAALTDLDRRIAQLGGTAAVTNIRFTTSKGL